MTLQEVVINYQFIIVRMTLNYILQLLIIARRVLPDVRHNIQLRIESRRSSVARIDDQLCKSEANKIDQSLRLTMFLNAVFSAKNNYLFFFCFSCITAC